MYEQVRDEENALYGFLEESDKNAWFDAVNIVNRERIPDKINEINMINNCVYNENIKQYSYII